MKITEWNWIVMMPEFTILGFATLISLMDLFLPAKVNRKLFAWIGLAGVIVAGIFVMQNLGRDVTQIMNDMFRLDGFGNIFKLIFLSGVGLVFILSLSEMDQRTIPHRGEFYYLIMTALLGAMMMASSADLITLFVGLELLSLSSYILVGARKRDRLSNESAFKYVVTGGIATAITLYGMSFIYGLTGSTNLFEIAQRLREAYMSGFGFVIILSFLLVLVGLSFKLAVAPFHMWAPDVYQGASTPITAFLAVVSKAAGFAIVLRLLLVSYVTVREDFIVEIAMFVAVVAAATMIIGNTLALRQTNVKRLMAYSSVAQAAYALVPLATLTLMFFDQAIFYLIAYLFMTLGAFAVLLIVTRDAESEDLTAFSGLYHRAPWLAVAMTVFLLSLAGLPITGGFFGKFYIFLGSLGAGKYWLAAVMAVTSVISYVYYFSIVRQMYMRPGKEEPLAVPASVAVVVLIAFIGTVGIGFAPQLVLSGIQTYFPNLGEMFIYAPR